MLIFYVLFLVLIINASADTPKPTTASTTTTTATASNSTQLPTVTVPTVTTPTTYSFPVFPVIELTKKNHVVLNGEINEELISKAIVDIGKITADEIVVYIVSPGGSVIAGNHFIQFMSYMRQSGKTFTCVADFAASMAFGILQECDNRYVTPTSILMQHQMSVGLQDQYENLKNRIQLLDAINIQLISRQARRVNLTVEDFKKKVVSDWWIYGDQCPRENVADDMVFVGCAPDLLSGTREEKLEFFGRRFRLVFSHCPLARAPISITEEDRDNKFRGATNMTDAEFDQVLMDHIQKEYGMANTTIRYTI